MLSTRLFWNIFMGYVVLIMGTTAILGWVVSERVSTRLLREIEDGLRDKAALLVEISRPALQGGDPVDLSARVSRLGEARNRAHKLEERGHRLSKQRQRLEREMEECRRELEEESS